MKNPKRVRVGLINVDYDTEAEVTSPSTDEDNPEVRLKLNGAESCGYVTRREAEALAKFFRELVRTFK